MYLGITRALQLLIIDAYDAYANKEDDSVAIIDEFANMRAKLGKKG